MAGVDAGPRLGRPWRGDPFRKAVRRNNSPSNNEEGRRAVSTIGPALLGGLKMFSKKTQNGQRKSLMAGASVLAAAAAAMTGTPAMAQDTEEEDVIVVTGSRIPQPNLQGTSPVTQVTSEDITTQGVTRLEDLTNQLPRFLLLRARTFLTARQEPRRSIFGTSAQPARWC